MTSFLISIFAGSFFKTAAGEIKAGWEWLFSSATHLLEAALLASLVWGWFGHHDAAKWHRVADSTAAARKADNAVWASADRINHASIATCSGSLEHISAAVRKWSDVSHAEQIATHKAVEAATARGRAAEALAHRLDAEAALAPATAECRTPKAVMDVRGQL